MSVENEIREAMMKRYRDGQKTKVNNYKELNQFVKKGSIVFTGSSLMEGFPVNELALSAGITKVIYNRGIGGYTTDDFLAAIGPQLLDLEPGKVFINIGTNDIKNDPAIPEGWQAHLVKNYDSIISQLLEKCPNCEVYMMAYYPVNGDCDAAKNGTMYQALQVRTKAAVIEANKLVKELAEKHGCHYIDANDGLFDNEGRLKEELTVDGVHMHPSAYAIVLNNLKQYI